MTETNRIRYTPDSVTAPGETLLEILQSRRMSQADLADRTGRPTKTINEIIKGKAAITPETALQLELVLGIPATFWNSRESQYREYLAKQKASEWLESQTDWLDSIPYREMVQAGWTPVVHGKVEQVQHALKFFGVASPASWNEVWRDQQAVFRQSTQFKIDHGAVAAWLRRGELQAQQLHSEPFEPSRFREALRVIRNLTRELPNDFARTVIEECRAAGVRVVFVPELPRTRVWGATRWLSPT